MSKQGFTPEAMEALRRDTEPAPLDATQPPLDAATRALCARYDVVTLDALVLALAAHVERLQALVGSR
jgi:hypothetical protein